MENELMEKIVKNQKKQSIMLVITMLSSLMICVCMVVLTMSVVSVMPKLTDTLTSVEELADSADTAVRDVEKMIPDLEASAKGLSSLSDSMQTEGLPKLYESLDNLNKIDVKTLNDSITSLYNVVEPMGRLFGR